MVTPGYIACIRGVFCLEGFPPEIYNPNAAMYCPKCLADLKLREKR